MTLAKRIFHSRESEQICSKVCAFLEEAKAMDVVCIDLQGKSTMADALVIASGNSQRHIQALGNTLKDYLHSLGRAPVSIEGLGSSDWVLLDAGMAIIHLFRPEVRKFYNLEKMWGADFTFPDLSQIS